MTERYRVAAVEKALAVLEIFAEPPHRFTLSEVAARTGMSSNQIFRLLQTLSAAGWLRHAQDSRLYSLGPRPFGLVRALFLGNELVVAGREPLQWAHDETRETVALLALDSDGSTTCVDVRESSHPLMVAQMLGARSPENHAGAAARVFLAAKPDAGVERFLTSHGPLERLTPWTIVDPDQLRADLIQVRQQGYAVSDQEVAVGMYGVAAPIYDRREALVGAITLSAPILRAGPDEQARHIVAVTEAARRISTNLGSRAVQAARNSA